MDYKVYIGFTTDIFTLDDVIRGKLNGSSGLGGAVTFTEVTSDVTSISIARGRSRETDEFNAGTCNFVLRNESGNYDPLNDLSPYYPGIEPLMEMKIEASHDSLTYYTIFRGTIDNWAIQYPSKKESSVLVQASDSISLLSATEILITRSAELSGTRISAILDDNTVGFPSSLRSIDLGNTTLQAATQSGTTIDVLRNIEQSENGALFVDREGKLVFKQRHNTFPTGSPSIVFSDDGSDFSYMQTELNLNDDLLFNRISVKREGGTTQTKSDATSQGKYRVRQLTRSGLNMADDIEAESAASFLLNKFKDPETRFAGLNISIDRLNISQQSSLAQLDLADIIKVELTPIGESSQRSKLLSVNNMVWNISPNSSNVTIGTADATNLTFLVLDDLEFGKLDSAKVAY